jgi:hypothetical protein
MTIDVFELFPFAESDNILVPEFRFEIMGETKIGASVASVAPELYKET